MTAAGVAVLDLTNSWVGFGSLGIFAIAYALVVLEETTHLRKSQPVVLAAGLIWLLIGIAYEKAELGDVLHERAIETIGEFGQLFLFLLVAITYVNTLEERRVFDVLRSKLVALGASYRTLFWLTGGLAFLLSSVLDNLTAALVMGAVLTAIGSHSKRFLALGCINIVVAANAGGAFSPFGDITTLMVWQNGKLEFLDFFVLLFPSLVNWLVPALPMQFKLPTGKPERHVDNIGLKSGTGVVVALFAITITTAICFRTFLHLPPALGMMLGLGCLQLWSYVLNSRSHKRNDPDIVLDSFAQIQRVEWDTLLFFFGIMFAVGGLGLLGYLGLVSRHLYDGIGPTSANIFIGALSAIFDNIPLMFAVLTTDPEMSRGQWLLVTLTCGVGGSLLSIGSAAGVALMGQARGTYTFTSHLRWIWAIALGYIASIAAHWWINGPL